MKRMYTILPFFFLSTISCSEKEETEDTGETAEVEESEEGKQKLLRFSPSVYLSLGRRCSPHSF